MFNKNISQISATEILDSRGNPTIHATVELECGVFGYASVPSGASTGAYEAHELRDGESGRYYGKGVSKAVNNINGKINKALKGMNPLEQQFIDRELIALDGSETKKNLGANAILAVSIATARAAANYLKIPLYRHIGGINGNTLPLPMMNILNGGAHSSNNVDIQEFMIMPVGADCFSESLRMGAEIFHALGKLLKQNGMSATVGDEGGFAPDLENGEDAVKLIVQAIKEADYIPGNDVKIALDIASTEWYKNGKYTMPKKQASYTGAELIDYFSELCDKYPIISLEDPLSEDDFEGFAEITSRIGNNVQIVGDDLFVTNTERLKKGIEIDAANAVLIKVNQIGTITETLEAIELAKNNGYKTIISHRSGETEDTFIADLAVALNSGQIKTGAPSRSDRTSKYNRLLMIEKELGKTSRFSPFCKNFCKK